MKTKILLTAALISSSVAQAQFTAITDDFSTDGDLFSSTPDSGVGDWDDISLTGSTLNVTSGAVTILAGNNQDMQLNFSSSDLTTGIIYAGFTLNVSDGTISGTNGSISTIFGFRDGTATSGSFELGFGLFRPNSTAQTEGALNTTTSQFQFGIGDGTSLTNGGTRWGSVSTYDTNYRVVIGWDLDEDEATLWIDPSTSSSTSVTATGLTGETRGIYIRQGSGTHGSSALSDLQVSTDFNTAANISAVPEPSSFAALLGLGALGFVATRRRGKKGSPIAAA